MRNRQKFMPTTLESARAYIGRLPLAVSGQRGHDATFRVACCLVNGFALAPDDALKLLQEYNERLAGRWTEHELRHKIDDAGRVPHQHPKGHLLRSKPTYKTFRQLPVPPVVRWPIRRKQIS